MTLTDEQRVELVHSPRVDIALRVEVLDTEDQILGEIDVDSCVVRHDVDADIHRTIEIVTKDELEWQVNRIRPWLTITNGTLTDEVALGLFVLTHPRPEGTHPQYHTVVGYDMLYLLDQKLLEPVSQPAGQPILLAVRQLLARYRLSANRIDLLRDSDVLNEPKVWPVEFDGTGLDVTNELLAMVGYDPVYIDTDGFVRSGPIIPIDQRPIAWRYIVQADDSIVWEDGRSLDEDYTDAPNYWVFWQADVVRDDPPVVGDGLYIVRNENEGPASINARGGLAVRSDNDGPVEAATFDDLVANGDRIAAEEKHAVSVYTWQTDVNPYHTHNEALEIVDTDFDVGGRFRHLSWELDVFDRVMSHSAAKILGGVT